LKIARPGHLGTKISRPFGNATGWPGLRIGAPLGRRAACEPHAENSFAADYFRDQLFGCAAIRTPGHAVGKKIDAGN
jgi:hypothetical protein